MRAMASQITSLAIVYSTETSKLGVTGLCDGNSPVSGEFPAQRASNAENVSIGWRHHDHCLTLSEVNGTSKNCISPVHVSLTELDFTVRVNINLYVIWNSIKAWWRHQMENFSTLMVLCAGNSPVTGEFFAQRPVMRSFDVFFELHQNKQLSKQSWGWWFETPSCPLWRQCNDICSQGICNYSTLWNRMTHICVGNLGHHWFR